jgi:hypothetical protein
MKRIGQIALTLILVFLIPAGFSFGQEKKDEKHIKVFVTDKGGEKIVMDTTIVSTDGTKTVKIVKGEPIFITDGEDGEKMVIVKSRSHTGTGEGGDVMSWTATSAGEKGSVVYISKGHDGLKDGEVKYNIEVRQDESGNKIEKTSYVIAKDGMVVTIEGGSEEKVKELAGVIESNLGVKKDDKAVKTEVREETKKTTKK